MKLMPPLCSVCRRSAQVLLFLEKGVRKKKMKFMQPLSCSVRCRNALVLLILGKNEVYAVLVRCLYCDVGTQIYYG